MLEPVGRYGAQSATGCVVAAEPKPAFPSMLEFLAPEDLGFDDSVQPQFDSDEWRNNIDPEEFERKFGKFFNDEEGQS